MSFLTEELVNFSAKGWLGILGTGDRNTAPDNFTWYEELATNDLIVKPGQIWSDYATLPPAANLVTAQANAVANPTLIGDYTQAGAAIHLTPAPNNKAFFATTVYGDMTTRLANWIMPQLIPRTDIGWEGYPSIGYMVRLYNGNPDLGGVEIATTAGKAPGSAVTAWWMNFGAGVIKISSDFAGIVDPTDVWLRGFRYIGPSGGGAAGNVERLTKIISQPLHGFAVGTILRFDALDQTYYKAKSTAIDLAEVVGMVYQVNGPNTFTLLYSGFNDNWTTAGVEEGTIVPGEVYFLSVLDGLVTSTPTSVDGYVEKPLIIAISPTSCYFYNMRGRVIDNSPSVSLTKIFYDSIMPLGDMYPETLADLNTLAAGRGAGQLVRFWDTKYGSRVKFQVQNTTLGTYTDDYSWPLKNDFVAWKNANIPNGGGVFTQQIIVRAYDELDPDVPVIDKISGTNRVYAGLMGRKRYKKHKPHFGGTHYNWTEGHAMKHLMFTTCWPMLAPFVTVADFNDGEDAPGAATIWTTKSKLPLYTFPPVGYSTPLWYGAGGRGAGCVNWEGLNPVGAGVYTWLAPKILFWSGATGGVGAGDASDCTIYDPADAGQMYALVNMTKLYSWHSMLLFYPIVGDQVDEDIAVFAKPVGQDLFFINWFDSTLYDLEAVYQTRDRQKVYFEVINPATFYRAYAKGDAIGIPKAYITPSYSRNTSKHCDQQRPFDVYFRLRDKSTGRVGALSRACIRTFRRWYKSPIITLVV